MENVKKHIKAIQDEFKKTYGLDARISVKAYQVDPSLAANVILDFDPEIENAGYDTYRGTEWHKLPDDKANFEVIMFHERSADNE